MNLREPRRKRRVKLSPQLPFPIPLNETQEWPVYTAHLTDMGSCILEPEEINAVHSMGFFGKGSLSRSFPSFGRARYGTPPVVRNRQWQRRQDWLKEVKELNSVSTSNVEVNVCDIIEDDKTNIQYEGENISDNKKENISDKNEENILDNKEENISDNKEENIIDNKEENISDVIEILPNFIENKSNQRDKDITKNMEIDEVVLDSAEEDDICVIMNKESNSSNNAKNSLIDHDEMSCTEEEKEVEELCDLDYYDFKSDCMNEDDNRQGKLLVLPDSESDTENYLKDIKPSIENEGFPIREALHLTFEETFFLLFGLGCLQVVHFDGSLLDINNAWLYFCKERPDFLQKYVVYHYYRSKGWVVKPALKYGGDFLLYKEGPPFYHASYIVIVEVVDADSLIVNPTISTRSMTWDSLIVLERLSETAGKVGDHKNSFNKINAFCEQEIVFAQVLWPSSVPQDPSTTSPEILSEFTVRELLWRRWNPKQHREDVPTEEEDDD